MITRRDLLLSVPTSVAGARLLHAQQPTFRVGAQNVPVYVTVTDANKRLVPGLEQGDFEIYDEKTKAPITIFDNQIQPVTVAVMLDSSGSMTMNLELLKQAAEQFVIRLLPEDRGRIGYFNDKIAFLSDFSNDRDMLIASIKDMQFGNPTRLFDSVLFSLDELKNVEGRKVDPRVHRRRRHGEPQRPRRGAAAGPRRGSDDLRDRAAVGDDGHADQTRRRPEEDGRGDRRRLLRVEGHRRPRADLHARRAGAAQPVPARLRAPDRRQGPQDRGPRQLAPASWPVAAGAIRRRSRRSARLAPRRFRRLDA